MRGSRSGSGPSKIPEAGPANKSSSPQQTSTFEDPSGQRPKNSLKARTSQKADSLSVMRSCFSAFVLAVEQMEGKVRRLDLAVGACPIIATVRQGGSEYNSVGIAARFLKYRRFDHAVSEGRIAFRTRYYPAGH